MSLRAPGVVKSEIRPGAPTGLRARLRVAAAFPGEQAKPKRGAGGRAALPALAAV